MSIAVALRPKVVPIFHSTALEGKLVNVCHYKLILFPLVSFFCIYKWCLSYFL